METKQKTTIKLACGPLSIGSIPRLVRLVKRYRLTAMVAKCPECGGVVELSDDGEMTRGRYRYTMGCRDERCLAAIGPSVKWVCEEWTRLCKANAKGMPPAESPTK